MKLLNLGPLTLFLAAMIVVGALWSPIVLASAFLFPEAFSQNITPIAQQVDLAASIFQITTIIVFSYWIYIAGLNLLASGLKDLEFSPASRIWWFFVPIASFVKPYQGMRELWNASRGTWPYDTNANLLGIWWALWLLSALSVWITGLAFRDDISQMPLIINSFIDIAQAIVAILLIRGIAQAQNNLDGTPLIDIFA